MYYKTDLGNTKTKQVVLLVTQACNLNCKYCYESFKTTSFMSIECCREILKKEFQSAANDNRTSDLAISFLGGEPLLNFELIKSVSEWLWSEERPVPYSLDIRTNGTLLTSEIREWLLANRQRIHVALSLDGLNEVQKLTRTDKPIDYRFFTDNWPEERVKIVLFKNTLPFFAKTIKEMVAERISISVDVGIGFKWEDSDIIVFEEQLEELMEMFIDDLHEGKLSGIFPFDVGLFFKETPDYYPFCTFNNNLVSYDADGTQYNCHLFSSCVIGKEKSEWIRRNGKLIKGIPVDPRCKNCPIYAVCKQCPAMNLKIHGDIGISASATTFCKMKKVQARECATVFLRHVQKLVARNFHLDEDMVQNAKNAIRLLKTIPEAKYL